MKAKDIKVGGHYIAKVNDKLVTVRVEEIGERAGGGTYYSVLNLTTNRGTTFRSAQKFRREVTILKPQQSEEPNGFIQITKVIAEEAKQKTSEKIDKNYERAAAQTVRHDQRQKEDEQRSDPTMSAKSAASQCHPSPTASKSPELEPSAASPAPVSTNSVESDPSVVEVAYSRKGILPNWWDVTSGYAHRNTFRDLRIGDVVTVPFFGSSESQKAVVVKIGSDYKGPLQPILSVVERKGRHEQCSDPTTSSAPSAASTSKTVGVEKPSTSPSSLASTIEHSKGDAMKDKPKLPPMTISQKAHAAEAGASFFSAARCIISSDMAQSLETIEDDVKFLCSTGVTAESTRSDYIDFFVAVCKKVLEMLGEKNPQNPT